MWETAAAVVAMTASATLAAACGTKALIGDAKRDQKDGNTRASNLAKMWAMWAAAAAYAAVPLGNSAELAGIVVYAAGAAAATATLACLVTLWPPERDAGKTKPILSTSERRRMDNWIHWWLQLAVASGWACAWLTPIAMVWRPEAAATAAVGAAVAISAGTILKWSSDELRLDATKAKRRTQGHSHT